MRIVHTNTVVPLRKKAEQCSSYVANSSHSQATVCPICTLALGPFFSSSFCPPMQVLMRKNKPSRMPSMKKYHPTHPSIPSCRPSKEEVKVCG